MKRLAQLSTQVGDRTEQSNRRIAALCLANPALLADIAEGLHSEQAALLGDCAEVFTSVTGDARRTVGVRGRFLRKKIDDNIWHHVSD